MIDETRTRLLAQLRQDEGARRRVYRDSRGILTIGVGHNLTPGQDVALTDAAVEAILLGDVANVEAQAAEFFPWFAALDQVRLAAVLNMLFNLGPAGLARFQQTIRALEARDWDAAAIHALNSLWAHQTGARAQRIAEQLRTGTWPERETP